MNTGKRSFSELQKIIKLKSVWRTVVKGEVSKKRLFLSRICAFLLKSAGNKTCDIKNDGADLAFFWRVFLFILKGKFTTSNYMKWFK